MEDYPAARAYRDSRINGLFEATNEINRLLVPGMLRRRAQRGRLPLLPAALRVLQELTAPPSGEEPSTGILDEERRLVSMAKKVVLFTAGLAVQKFLDAIEEQQEILAGIAGLVVSALAMESPLLRTLRALELVGVVEPGGKKTMVQSNAHDALTGTDATARTVPGSA